MTHDVSESHKLDICRYCKKPLQYTKCPKNAGETSPAEVIADILGVLGILLVIVTYIFTSSSRKKELKNKKIITCTNPNCIDFLHGCFGKKGLYT